MCRIHITNTTNGNYFTGTDGSGTALNAGDAISSSQTIYIYNAIGTAPNICDNETSFNVTVSTTPAVDTIADQTVCAEYILPTLTNGNYFTGTDGSGTALNAGDAISSSQTIYIYSAIGTAPNICDNETSFDVTVSTTPAVDSIADQTVCAEYILPTLTNGNYFTGTDGSGTALNAGDAISSSQTIYIYSAIGTAPNICDNETSFDVTVSTTPAVDSIADQTVCAEYILPTLTNGNYFTGTDGSGTALNAGDAISSSQTIYIYSAIGTAPNICDNETSFDVTVSTTPAVDSIADQTVCAEYILPTLTNGNYFTGTDGSGTALNAGDVISSSQTIYIYNEIGTTPNICFSESNFDIEINAALDFSLDESNISINTNTISISMTDTSIDYEYAIDNSIFQASNTFNNLADGSHILYVRDKNGCVLKSLNFEITAAVELFIPVFFTPNNDTFNDSWTVIDPNNIVEEILIFNRYGKLIKQLIPSNYSWDGYYNGKMLESNDFWYLITLKNAKQLKGHFALKH